MSKKEAKQEVTSGGTSKKATQKTTKKIVQKTSPVVASEIAPEIAREISQEEAVTTVTPETEAKPLRVKELSPNQVVSVYNGLHNRLIYQSKKTGEMFAWDEFGDSQEMELSELKSAKSSHKRFFTDNWFVFDDPAIVEYLGVAQFYKFALNIQNFDSVFQHKPEEVGEVIAQLSNGQKKAVAHRARLLIGEGELDSIKLILALEKSLGVELVEH